MVLFSMILQAATGVALGKVGAAMAAAIVALAAAFGLGKIGKAALDNSARQPEAANGIRTTAIIIGALVEGVCLFAVIVCLLAIF